jgi:hypothetical protein
MSDILLSICIPTVVGREEKLQKLLDNLGTQIHEHNLFQFVEIIVDKDNKEVSIGEKRDRMYKGCSGLFSVQIDDDDDVAKDYLITIMENMDERVDCIGYQELCIMDGKKKKSDFSIKYDTWKENTFALNGFHHLRTPFCKSPIKTTICKFVGVKDMRFGEDHDFAKRVKQYLRTETYINKEMYIYQYTSENHKVKYGIK